MTHRREIQAIYLVLFENKLGGAFIGDNTVPYLFP